MKRVAFLCLLASGAAIAQTDTFVDNARVRNVEPQYQTVQVPRNECRSDWVSEPRPVAAAPNYGGMVIGAIAGGVLGNQVGKGHGREAATAAGAVVGAVAGDRIAAANRAPQYEEVQREVRSCRQVMDQQTRIEGYRVTYEYRGREYTSVMRDDPGRTVPVHVSVTPVQH
ncbi:MAG: glycine zipper 2TM domain-containing protein [Pseudoxanthomonas sp.]